MGVMDWLMIIFEPEEQQLSMINFFFFRKDFSVCKFLPEMIENPNV